MKLEQLNELQMPTWHWLHMNETNLDIDADLSAPYKGEVTVANGEQILVNLNAKDKSPQNLPADMERIRAFVHQHKNVALTLTIPKGVQLDEPVVIDFVLDKNSPSLLDYIQVKGEESSRADIVITYRNGDGGSYFHGGFASVETKEGANIRLIKTQLLGKEDVHVDTTALVVDPHSNGNAIICELGGKNLVSSGNLLLTGHESKGVFDCLYLGEGNGRQDFNYRLELRGKESEGEIVVKGALADSARKVLKSTLDFISGAAGAKGREEETVLSLSDRVINLSAPLLLCGEENVIGEHATTSGKPDAHKLYYLMSRGFSEKEATRLLVEASFTPILNKIPSETLRESVLSRVQEVVHGDA